MKLNFLVGIPVSIKVALLSCYCMFKNTQLEWLHDCTQILGE